MYYDLFGLNEPPFKITPDTDFFFDGGNRGAMLEALIYAITHGEGIVKVTGEVGSGKTMLCRVLQARLPANVETVYLANPSVSPRRDPARDRRSSCSCRSPRDAGRLEVMHALQRVSDRAPRRGPAAWWCSSRKRRACRSATLEEIRLLSNLETKQHKLLQIVLFGQPELDENLRQAEDPPAARAHHPQLLASGRSNADEVRDYIDVPHARGRLPRPGPVHAGGDPLHRAAPPRA